MQTTAHSPILSSLFALLIAAGASLTAAPAAAELQCHMIPRLERAFLQKHVSRKLLDEELEARTIENHLRRLDSSRMMLLQEERDALAASMKGIFKEIEAGRCDRLMEIHRTLVRHHEAAAKYVRTVVSAEGFEIDENVELVLDADERGNPKTAEERDDVQRRWIHFQLSNYVTAGTELSEARQKLIERYERRLKHVLDIPREDVYAAFLDAFATALDPHSNYLSPRVFEDFRIGMSLSLEGIGVALSERDGYAVAERIIPGGAADRHGGLRPKDKIIAVAQGSEGESVDIIDMPLRDAVALIRGKKGTEVALTVLRQGETTERFSVTIVRDKIDLTEQAATLRFEEREVEGRKLKLAILELPSFYGDSNPEERQCTDDVARLLREVNEAEADGLLLDLSRNGGGLLTHAVEISGFFIREGDIVGIENSRGRLRTLPDRDDDILYSGPMVVHTSRVSASAAEILAGALQDYDRAVITGDDRTFGKGSVQTVTALPEGQGALKITTALFFRPGGRSTQNDGVASDVVIPSILGSDDLGEQSQRYALAAQETKPFLGDKVNHLQPEKRWQVVSPQVVGVLAKRSAARVAESERFAEVQEDIAEARANDGVVRLADIRKRQEEAKAERDASEEARSEDEKPETARSEDDESDASAAAEDDESDASAAAEDDESDASAAAKDDKEPTAQLEEALDVLTDLVTLTQVVAVNR